MFISWSGIVHKQLLMLLFVSLLFRNCNVTSLNNSFYRCTLTRSGVRWSNNTQFAFFLHQTSRSNVSFVVEGVSGIPDLLPGNSITFFKPVFARCSGDDCHLSVWNTSYEKGEGYLVSDAAGASYVAESQIFEDRYPAFFDFGPNTRVVVKELSHPRGRGAQIMYVNSTTNVVENPYIHEGDIFYFSSPGILQVSASPYENVNFHIIAGSTVVLPQEFYNLPSLSSMVTVTSNGEIEMRVNDTDRFCYTAKENDIWKHLKIIMFCVTGMVFLSSILGTISVCCGGKKDEDSTPGDLEQPLIH